MDAMQELEKAIAEAKAFYTEEELRIMGAMPQMSDEETDSILSGSI